MVENDLIDCIVNLPTKLFLNTQIPACLWFFIKQRIRSAQYEALKAVNKELLYKYTQGEHPLLVLIFRWLNMRHILNRPLYLPAECVETVSGLWNSRPLRQCDLILYAPGCEFPINARLASTNLRIGSNAFVHFFFSFAASLPIFLYSLHYSNFAMGALFRLCQMNNFTLFRDVSSPLLK